MNKQHQDPANELYRIATTLESAVCLQNDPTANDLTWSLIAWAQGTAEEAADRLMREQPSPINQDDRPTIRVRVEVKEVAPSRLEALLEQFADALEQTDLCRQERAQFSALLDALRVEVGLCQEVLA